mmetsp:Transcript_2477/g.7275  ORF Transcript_2477/g.7275 Transcript_2477/m.7275 type:complete len:286 (+) Transcript_2477:3-860(+)
MEEEAYVLRLPDSLAARVADLQHQLGSGQELDMDVEFVNAPGHDAGRVAKVRIGSDHFPAVLMDLPTVVESGKSLDGVNYYKSGHVSQVLVVSELMMKPPRPQSYVLPDGLTPPTKGIRAYWSSQRPMRDNDVVTGDVQRVEAKLKRILDGQGADDEAEAQDGGDARPAHLTSVIRDPHLHQQPNFAYAPQGQPGAMLRTHREMFGDDSDDDDLDDDADPLQTSGGIPHAAHGSHAQPHNPGDADDEDDEDEVVPPADFGQPEAPQITTARELFGDDSDDDSNDE